VANVDDGEIGLCVLVIHRGGRADGPIATTYIQYRSILSSSSVTLAAAAAAVLREQQMRSRFIKAEIHEQTLSADSDDKLARQPT